MHRMPAVCICCYERSKYARHVSLWYMYICSRSNKYTRQVSYTYIERVCIQRKYIYFTDTWWAISGTCRANFLFRSGAGYIIYRVI